MTEPAQNSNPATVDELPPLDDLPAEDGTLNFAWTSDQIALPSEHFMLAHDIPGLERYASKASRKILVANAAAGDAKAKALCDLTQQVYLEMMHRSRERREKEDSRGRPLYLDQNGKETTLSSAKVEGELMVFKRATEVRCRYAVAKGREAQSGPGVPYVGEAAWLRRVNESWYDLLPRLEFKELSPDFAPKDYPTENAVAYAKREHADKVLNDQSAERQKLLRWLKPFLKNPACKWDGEK